MALVTLGAGIALTPWGRRLRGKDRSLPTPGIAPEVSGVSQQVLDDAFRDARLAQEAAEKLSEMLSRFQINRQQIADAQSKRQPDTEALEAYRLAEETIERQIRECESDLILRAGQLRSYAPEVQAQALDRLTQYVSTAKVNWRIRVAELLRTYLPRMSADTTRVDPALREALRKLQSPP